MILRKPYAFLIKHFKMIHLILSFFIGYLLYKSYNLYTFISKFSNSGEMKIALNSTDKLFDFYMFLFPWIIIVILGIILVILFKKKKPTLFYIINVIIFIAVIPLNKYIYSGILFAETNIVEAQKIKLYVDFSFIMFIAEVISFIVVFIRGVGLDIKKFDFGKDLLDLDLKEEDSEEFEVEIKFDSNKAKRYGKKSLRFLKYFYIEHKFTIRIIFFIVIMTIGFSIYITKAIYMQHYDEGEYFSYESGTLSIKKSYVTNSDAKGYAITTNDKILVVLAIEVRSRQNLNLARMELHIGDKKYYPNMDYSDKLLDYGETYKKQDLKFATNNNYIVSYEIPTNLIHEEMYFKYLSDYQTRRSEVKSKYIKVLLTPIYMDKTFAIQDVEYDTDININDNFAINISNIEVEPYFTINYNFCISSVECVISREYIKPSLNTNYDKAIIKITGSYKQDVIESNKIKNIYNVIAYFGKVIYTKDDKEYTVSSFSKIDPTKTKNKNELYLEINKDIMDADSAYLILGIKDKKYRYEIIKNNKTLF